MNTARKTSSAGLIPGRVVIRMGVLIGLIMTMISGAFCVRWAISTYHFHKDRVPALQVMYRLIRGGPPVKTLRQAEQTVGLLRLCQATNNLWHANSARILEPERVITISNLVLRLEYFSGEHFGTNVHLWELWLGQQGIDPNPWRTRGFSNHSASQEGLHEVNSKIKTTESQH